MVFQGGKLVIELVERGMVVMMVSPTTAAEPTRKWDPSHSLISLGAGTCKACRKGYFQMCDNGVVNGETKGGGCKCFSLLQAAIPFLYSED